MNDRARHRGEPATGPLLPGQPDLALPPGMRLGAFEIRHALARSASSIVYLATDLALAMPVAIQEYLPARLMCRDAGLQLRAREAWHAEPIERGLRAFIAEARLLAHCDHPSLVRVLHLFEARGSAYRVMPAYSGKRLSDVRRAMVGAPAEPALRALLGGLLGAVETIHRSGEVHGNVTPSNILLLGDELPMLLGPGAAAREIGSDRVSTLMAELASPSHDGAEAMLDDAAQPVGVDLDLCGIATVLRFCIGGEVPAPPGAMRRLEPLAVVIAREFERSARPQYSAALLDTLDAAVAPDPKDRPLTAAQFRDWLAHGVPGAPRHINRTATAPVTGWPAAAPIGADIDLEMIADLPIDEPAGVPTRAGPAPVPPIVPARTEPAFSDEPLAPWPDLGRLREPSIGATAPAMPPLPKIGQPTQARRRRYQWLMAAALAALAVAVLAFVTGAFDVAPDILLGPAPDRASGLTAPRTTPSDPAAEPAAAGADPARALADAPPSAGAARASSAPLPAPAAPVLAGTSPRTACAGRTEFALYRCMQQQCGTRRWSTHSQCVRLRQDDRVD